MRAVQTGADQTPSWPAPLTSKSRRLAGLPGRGLGELAAILLERPGQLRPTLAVVLTRGQAGQLLTRRLGQRGQEIGGARRVPDDARADRHGRGLRIRARRPRPTSMIANEMAP